MRPIRVLVVDDSVVVRRVVSDALGGDPEIEVVGTASNGRIALARIDQLRPSLVTMDIEMPEMDGLETLRELRKAWPALPVIMFSTLTERAAASTLDALALGANDYVTKPSGFSSTDSVIGWLGAQLIPKIKALTSRGVTWPDSPTTRLAPRPMAGSAGPAQPESPAAPIEAVAIGASTGGPNALAAILPQLPAGLNAPVLIVQHMPPLFTRLLATRLARLSALEVKEAEQGEPVVAGRVYLAPGDWHMEVVRERGDSRIALHQGQLENSCRPAVDVLFRSAASAYGGGTLGVVLTGMGRDGFRGAEAIRLGGGQILAQDQATSVVWGMPGFIAASGLADQILPLDAIGPAIARRVLAPRKARRAGEGACR